MGGVSSPTTSAAFQGLVQRQNQALLDGAIAAVMANGQIIVVAQEVAFVAPTIIDHIFQVGEPVLLARSDEDEWVVIGTGTTGIQGSVSPARPPTGIVSQSLHEAVLRLVNKRNQILRKGTVIGLLDDGSLVVRLKIADVVARAETSQVFAVGHVIYAILHDDATWRVLGSR
jgi:hypothetical protein